MSIARVLKARKLTNQIVLADLVAAQNAEQSMLAALRDVELEMPPSLPHHEIGGDQLSGFAAHIFWAQRWAARKSGAAQDLGNARAHLSIVRAVVAEDTRQMLGIERAVLDRDRDEKTRHDRNEQRALEDCLTSYRLRSRPCPSRCALFS